MLATPTASVAVNAKSDGGLLGLAGADVIVTTGAMVSCTVTVNDPAPVLPAVSVAEHATVVVPSGKVAPDAGAHVTAGAAGAVSSVAAAE